jgi:hypothetical protein
LIIVFDAFGNLVIDDKPHIRLIDAHSKGYGCYNDLDLVSHPVFLIGLSLLRSKGGMIHGSLDS